jgi:fermentation-respiration switch protein FrsA (DUF1100 family)
MKVFILALGGAYVLLLIAAYVFQSRLVFFPARQMAGDPGDVGLEFEDVWLPSGSGKRIHGWFVPAKVPRATLLFFHGNAGNISHRLESIKQFVDLQLSVLIIDYHGYGQSEGKPSERATYQDSRAAWDYLVGERGLRPRDIVLFGRSLGGAVAIELATEVEPLALIVESCFTSAVDMGTKVYPWLPIRLVRRIHYNSLSRVRDVAVPKLFIHSFDDKVVPFGMGKRLYSRAPRPKQFLKIRGGHNDGFMVSAPLYGETIDNFLRAVQEMKGSSQ